MRERFLKLALGENLDLTPQEVDKHIRLDGEDSM
jgi:hypothetical protein